MCIKKVEIRLESGLERKTKQPEGEGDEREKYEMMTRTQTQEGIAMNLYDISICQYCLS